MDNPYPNEPSSARIYDYWLGGTHNFPIDRMAADTIQEMIDARNLARINREFMRDAVLWVAQQGVEQFIDIGSGIPTQGNVHEVALQSNKKARIVYVDIDPTAVAHSRTILGKENPSVAVIQANMQEPESVLKSADTQRLIDFTQPVVLLFIAMLHFIPDNEEMYRVVRQYRDATVSGSYLVVSHAIDKYPGDPTYDAKRQSIQQASQGRGTWRTTDEVKPIWEGYNLIKPGFVSAQCWGKEGHTPIDYGVVEPYSGVGRRVS